MALRARWALHVPRRGRHPEGPLAGGDCRRPSQAGIPSGLRRGQHAPAQAAVSVLHDVAAARSLGREEHPSASVAPDPDRAARGPRGRRRHRDEDLGSQLAASSRASRALGR